MSIYCNFEQCYHAIPHRHTGRGNTIEPLSTDEKVNHPPHYTAGGIEVIDIIEAWALNFHLGNAVKYILRAEHKGSRIEDLKKASWYLQREIERWESVGKEDGNSSKPQPEIAVSVESQTQTDYSAKLT